MQLYQLVGHLVHDPPNVRKVPLVFYPLKSYSTYTIFSSIVFLYLSYTHQVPSVPTKSRQSSALLCVPQGSPIWIPRNLPRGGRHGGKHACHVLTQSADATNVFQLANDAWKRTCLASTFQVARMPAEPSEHQE